MFRRWFCALMAAALMTGLLVSVPPSASAYGGPSTTSGVRAAPGAVVGAESGGPTWITGTLQGDQTWGPEGSPYVIDGTARVTTGNTLTLLPGTVVKFFPTTEDPDNPTTFNFSQLLMMGGRLVADGTASEPIVFTSYHDDTAGGDTDGDGRAPARGDWYNITFTAPDVATATDMPVSVMDNVSVRYGGEGSGSACQAYGAVEISNLGRVQITSSEFLHAEKANIQIDTPTKDVGSALVRNSRFADSGCGMHAQGGDVLANVFEENLDAPFWALAAKGLRFYGNWLYEQAYIGEGVDGVDRTEADLRDNALLGGVSDNPQNQDHHDLAYNWWGPDPAPDSGCYDPDKTYVPIVHWTYTGTKCSEPLWYTITGYFTKVTPMLASAPPMPEVGIGADPYANLTVPDGQTYGVGSEFGYRPTGLQADPVNSATGSYVDEVTDAAVASLGAPLALTRTYNSADTSSGSLGKGWSFGYDVRLTFPDADHSVFVAGDGQRLRFTKKADGSWNGDLGVTATLDRRPDGSFRLTTRSQLVYAFDSSGKVLSVLDRNDQGVTFSYDRSGRLSSASGAGRTLKFAYNGSLLQRVTLPNNSRVTYGYGNGLLTSVTDPDGGVTSYGYDGQGRLVSETNPLNKTVMRLAYDPSTGRVSDQWDALDHHTRFAWDAGSEKATMTDPRGGEWVDDYSGNVLVSRKDPLGRTTTYQYDHHLQLIAAINPRGVPTTLSYDENGDLVESTGPLGTVRTSYNANHEPVSSVNAKGTETRYGYDDRGNLTSLETIPADGSPTLTESYTVDARGLVTAATDAAGKTTSYAYSSQGDLTRVTSPEGRATAYGYDALGRLTSSVDPRGNVSGANPADFTTTYAYNGRGLLTSVTNPLGHRTTTAYDAAGRLVSSTDAKQRTSSYTYDDAGRLVSVKGPDPAVPATTAAYDANGNVKAVTDAAGRTVTYAYDLANQRTSATGPLGAYTLGYDKAGNLTSIENPAGQTTTMTYAGTGRLTRINYPDSTPDVTYRYDVHGNRTGMDDGGGTVTYTYDALDRLTQTTRGTNTFTYDYNKLGRITAGTNPTGRSFSYSYDGDGLLEKVTDASNSEQLASYTYDAAGLPKSGDLADGSTWTRQYDAAGRLTRLTDTRPEGSKLLDDSLTLDAVGNPTQIRHGDGSTDTYTYDLLDRLTAVCYGTANCSGAADYVRWEYDASGNRTSETRPDGRTDYTYDADTGLLTTVTKPGGASTSYTHDALGRMKTAGAETFSYNLADRLVSTTRGGATTSFTYDGDGRRLKATNPSGTTNFWWDPRSYQLVGETDANANVLRSYAHGLSLLSTTEGSATSYLHADAQGSVRAITDADGAVDWRRQYEPFGVVRSSEHVDESAPQNPIGFAGEYTDPDGNIHLRARQYDPTLGAFTTPDPLPATSWSGTTTYASGNPMVFADPYGLFSLGDAAGIVNAIAPTVATVAGIGALAFPPAAPVLGPIAGAAAVLDAGASAYLAWDTCSNGAKGACGGAVVTAAISAAGAVPGGLLLRPAVKSGQALLSSRLAMRNERGAIGLPSAGRLTNSQAADMANRLGYRRTNFIVRGQRVFTDGKTFIVQDIDSHSGGLWKMARRVDDLNKKETRMGTYDYDLNYIGP